MHRLAQHGDERRPRPCGPTGGRSARVSAALWRRAWLRATLTLTPPLAWFLVIYLASLVVMLVTAFWTVNPFTNTLVHSWTLANFQQLFTGTYLTIIGRTVGMAALVTVTDAVLAFPFAYYMARVASPRGAPGCCSPRCCCRCGPATSPASTPGS